MAGKLAIVTGATSGIGKVTAEHLAKAGYTVVLGVRNVDGGKEVADEIMKKVPDSKVEVGPKLDLASQESVKAFATAILADPRPLALLINNAGVSFMKKWFTEDGVGGIVQTNHLGPYTLTRMLEGKLVAAKGRVVTVSSILHRSIRIKDAQGLMTEWRQGFYEHSKLANVLFAFEVQRRLGAHGVQSVVADPGGVRTNIWNSSPLYSKGFMRAMIEFFYSPPEDGALSVVHAALVPWEEDQVKADGSKKLPHEDLRYYARGLFASPVITGLNPPGKSPVAQLAVKLRAVGVLVHALMDWPLRQLSKGALGSKTYAVPAAKQSYDEKLAAEIWDVSAQYAKLPAQVQLA